MEKIKKDVLKYINYSKLLTPQTGFLKIILTMAMINFMKRITKHFVKNAVKFI